MVKNLGQIFYNGKLINLGSANEDELQEAINSFEREQVKCKEIINNIFNRLKMEK